MKRFWIEAQTILSFHHSQRIKKVSNGRMEKKNKKLWIYLDDGQEHIDAQGEHRVPSPVLTVRKSALY